MLGTGAKKRNSNCGPYVAVGTLLLCLCVNSWAECISIAEASWIRRTIHRDCYITGSCTGTAYTGEVEEAPAKIQKNGRWFVDDVVEERCTGGGCYCTSGWRVQCTIMTNRIYKTRCDTEAEADSVVCVNNPDLPECAHVTDTTLFACSESLENGQAVSTIYRLSCKATNGVVTECNGKQDVDISTDGTPVKQMSGTCAQNGLQNGVFGGSSAQDSLPNGANADCFAITGSTCHMRDKVSGNTFTCACDGSCNVAIQNLMAGNANCSNPYPQPTSASDSLNLDSSGSSPGSSGSGGGESSPSGDSSGSGGSSPSSSGSGEGGTPEDFEYDYTAVLEAIRANTQYTGNEVNDLNYKADRANEYLQQIAGKDWNPTINVGGPSVTLNADTAKSGAAILGLLNGKLNGGEPNANDTAGTGARLDGYLSSIDSIVGEGTPDMSDSLGNAVRGMHGAYNALKDSLGNSAWSDSVGKWQNALTNNGVISGAGTDACPAVLTRTWDVPLGAVTASVGPLGKYLCTPFAGNLTGWALARILLRALVSIFCMIWLFKAVMGIDGGNNEED